MLASLFVAAAAFTPNGVMRASAPARASTSMSEEPIARRAMLGKVLGASAMLGAAAANAEIDYAGVGFLGGAKTIDVNNANIRVYQKLPGLYPKAGFPGPESAAVKKYDANFIFLEPRPEYII